MAQADALQLDYDSSETKNTLEDIKNIMIKAVDAYHALCTAGKWIVNHKL